MCINLSPALQGGGWAGGGEGWVGVGGGEGGAMYDIFWELLYVATYVQQVIFEESNLSVLE